MFTKFLNKRRPFLKIHGIKWNQEIFLRRIICQLSRLIKILNAPSEKILLLRNFCNLFPVLFYKWNTQVLMTVSDFLGFFSKNHFLEGALFINWRGSILSGAEGGGVGGREHRLWWGGFEKIMRWGAPHSPPPTPMAP